MSGHDDKRLKHVLQNRPRGVRGVGRTYAACWKLCKQLDKVLDAGPQGLPAQQILYIVPSRERGRFVADELRKVMHERFPALSKAVTWTATSLQLHHVQLKIEAVPEPGALAFMRGSRDPDIVDDFGEYADAYFERFLPKILALLCGQDPQGKDRNDESPE